MEGEENDHLVSSFYVQQRNSCTCPFQSTKDGATVLYGSSANLSAEALVNNSEIRSPCLDFLRHFRKLS